MTDTPASKLVETIEAAYEKWYAIGNRSGAPEAIARALTEAGLVAGTPKPPVNELLSDVKRLLGEALLVEQKNENAFEASDRPMNRRVMHDQAKAAWKAYDDALELLAATRPPETPKAWTEEEE